MARRGESRVATGLLSGWHVPREGVDVECEHSELDVGFEGLETSPVTAGESVGSFACGDDPFDAGPPFAKRFVDTVACDEF